MSDDMELRQQAEAFIAENLHDIAAEIIGWNKTALLCNGRLREAAVIMEPTRGDDALAVVEKWAVKLILQFVVDNKPETAPSFK